MNNYRRYGFSLVELLVVAAVISLLATLLIPTLTGIEEHTRVTTCRTNLKELAEGIASAGEQIYPAYYRRFMMDNGLGGVLNCPSDDDVDTEAEDEIPPDLDDIFLVQKQGGSVRFSNVRALSDPDADVRGNAFEAIGRCTGRWFKFNPNATGETRARSIDEIKKELARVKDPHVH